MNKHYAHSANDHTKKNTLIKSIALKNAVKKQDDSNHASTSADGTTKTRHTALQGKKAPAILERIGTKTKTKKSKRSKQNSDD